MPDFSELIGKHSGEKALVVGCGPSVRDFPLEELHSWSGPTYGVNRCLYWFQPRYYLNIYKNADFICDSSRKNKQQYRFGWSEPVNKAREYGTGLLSLSTVGLTALTAAYQMGCKEIHLVGIDFESARDGGPYFYQTMGDIPYMTEKQKRRIKKDFKFAFAMMQYDGVKIIQHNKGSLVQP